MSGIRRTGQVLAPWESSSNRNVQQSTPVVQTGASTAVNSNNSGSSSQSTGQNTGYRSVTNYAKGKPYQGYEKVGTSYNPDTGYLEHASGYKGQAYQGSDGRYYTPEGSLIREDNYLYPEGAKISPNGMYYDNGNGWQLAKYAVQGVPGSWSHLVQSDYYGAAPHTLIGNFGGGSGTTSKKPATEPEKVTPAVTPAVTPEPPVLDLPALEEKIAKTYLNNYTAFNGQDLQDRILDELMQQNAKVKHNPTF